MKKFLCRLSKDGWCEYGGNKHYNAGFVSGMASYCRKSKKWVCDLEKCPLEKNQIASEVVV